MKKELFKIAILLTVTMLVLVACSSNKKSDINKSVKEEKEDNTLNISSTSDIPTMDSSLATDEVAFNNFNQTLEGLYILDDKDNPQPGVATGDPKKSDDGKTWIINLRKDAKWSNGDPVTAHDFVYSWQRTVNPNTGAEFAYMLENIKNATEINKGDKKPEELGVKAVDDHTLEIQLVKDVPWMKGLFAYGTFMPQNQKFVESKGDKFGTTAENTLSNGPFILKEWKTEDKWKLVPNEKYWDKENVKLDEVNYKVVKESQTALNMYQTGKLDTVPLDAQNVQKYKKGKDFSTELLSSSYFFRINGSKNKDLENESLRQAFAKSIDKETYVKSLLNNGSRATDQLTPKNFVKNGEEDYYNGVKKALSYNKKEAKKLLEKAKKETGKEKFEIEFLTYDADESKKSAEFVKEQVEQNLPGVTLNIKQQPFKQKLELESKEDYEISFGGWGPGFLDPTTFLELFTKDSANNSTGFANDEYDKLLKEANSDEMLKPENEQKRMKMLQEAESKLLESGSIVPMYQNGAARLRQPYVKNWHSHAFGGDYSFKEIEIRGSNK